MKNYVCQMNSTSGLTGAIIQREPEDESTRLLLERGIIAEVKIVVPAETKKRKAKA